MSPIIRQPCRIVLAATASIGLLLTLPAHALVEVDPLLPPSLKTVPVREPSQLEEFVRDKQAAIALGKALFWDQQVGNDQMACATCHYHAGADSRTKNQLNPGQRRTDGGDLDNRFDPTFTQTQSQVGTAASGPNYQLKLEDFPLYRLSDPTDRNSEVVFNSDDVVGSQGVFAKQMFLIDGRQVCFDNASVFHAGGHNTRQTTPRNAPSVINAVFNYRNFWDGRANHIFNGLDPFGDRHAVSSRNGPTIFSNGERGKLVRETIALENASLASQALGPALSDVEMSCAGQQFRQLGRKMLGKTPLKRQVVDPADSVLGPYVAENGQGLRREFVYRKMVQTAFQPRYWDSQNKVNGYSLMENNFSLFWGLAIQLYESTLVADDTPYDRFRENPWNNPLTEQQLRGMNVFAGKGLCISCHRGSEFTAASISHVTEAFVERMPRVDGEAALYDTGFYNIGVRPTAEDIGVGGADPWGNPLSFTRQTTVIGDGTTNQLNLTLDPILVSSSNFLLGTGFAVSFGETDAVDGAFKTPSLRNVELTGPYFHNGSYATLRQVIEFYHRGGNRRDTEWGDTSGFANNSTNLAPDLADHIDPWDPTDNSPTLNLTPEDMDDLEAFLKALTDERVRWERAPFDHPSLTLPDGHPADSARRARIAAKTNFTALPAIGAAGRSARGLEPLKSFEESLPNKP